MKTNVSNKLKFISLSLVALVCSVFLFSSVSFADGNFVMDENAEKVGGGALSLG